MPYTDARTVVVTGASAGVGRATALAFGRRRWNVALLAREPHGLESVKKEVEQAGGTTLAIPTDMSEHDAVFGAAEEVIARWGGFDVWVNDAMVTMFAPIGDIDPAEFRRITEVTYLGYVFGTMAALRHMRSHNRGTIVQVGSALSYRAIPLQSAYCGAKFAIRGFTDALRSELQHEGSAVRVTMVQLPAVNTPQFDWARNKVARRPQPMPPIYQPEVIAEIIFRASRHVRRELWLGIPSLKAILGTMLVPGLLDRLLARNGYEGQLTSEPKNPAQPDNLFQPVRAGHAAHGRFDDRAWAYTAAFNPSLVRTVLIASVLAVIFAAGFVTASVLGDGRLVPFTARGGASACHPSSERATGCSPWAGGPSLPKNHNRINARPLSES
jgi:NAD(P)-dependent dehydrogenase (short-subunit alcohol dehydrogenase family)